MPSLSRPASGIVTRLLGQVGDRQPAGDDQAERPRRPGRCRRRAAAGGRRGGEGSPPATATPDRPTAGRREASTRGRSSQTSSEELERRLEQMELAGRARFVGVQQPGQRVVAGPARPIPPVISQSVTQRTKDLNPRPQAGRAGAVPTGSDGRPHAPCVRPTSRISSARRVLPTPGSPEMSTSRPMPAKASSRARVSRRSGSSRPTRGGLPTGSIVAGLGLARREFRSRAYWVPSTPSHER